MSGQGRFSDDRFRSCRKYRTGLKIDYKGLVSLPVDSRSASCRVGHKKKKEAGESKGMIVSSMFWSGSYPRKTVSESSGRQESRFPISGKDSGKGGGG
jgi:hypothetical protein